jgi:fructokinase
MILFSIAPSSDGIDEKAAGVPQINGGIRVFDIVALGESLIDFTPSGVNELGVQLFARNPGGAPANVLAMAAKLGRSTAFIGKVGSDDFGRFLRDTMSDAGIDVRGLRMADDVMTTLAFVQLSKSGDRSFSFYRKPGADVCLRSDEVDGKLLDGCGIFHFGSVSLTDEPSRTATLDSARRAKENGAVISFDPNYRPPLWDSETRARGEMLAALSFADIIKVSDNELELLTGTSDLEKGAKVLAQDGAVLVMVTLGPKGAYFSTQRAHDLVPTYDVRTVDTTGAGDAFVGALLASLAGMTPTQIAGMSGEELRKTVAFCNAAGSLATTKHGAIPSLPTREEIEKCVSSAPLLGA